MVKCIECGFEAPRLQWTHFKYKCTGRFSNGTEYLKAYPEAKVVDEELKNRTKLTEENFIKKYGQSDGIKRWNEYRYKQAHSNSFEYKKEKHGWTKEQFDNYNSSRAQTIEKMIDRHGEIEGIKRWEEYCERQAYTNTKEYFIEKYGLEIGTKKYLDYNKEKSTSTNPMVMSERLGIPLDEAVEIIISRNSSSKYGSLIEKEFTEELEKNIGKLEHTTFTKPYGKWSHELNSYLVYDIKHNNCIIEFNGDYWHANPKLYESTDKLRNNKTAEDIWKKDAKKLQIAIDHGFRVMVVWEYEYKKDKKGTIRKVIEWMQNGQK